MKLLIFCALSLYSGNLVAMECQSGNTKRVVEVIPDQKTGCKVTVNGKAIYNAKHDKSYCESKFKVHVEKLGKKGFVCK